MKVFSLYYINVLCAIMIVAIFGFFKNISLSVFTIFLLSIPLISAIIFNFNFKEIKNLIIGYTPLKRNKNLIIISLVLLTIISLSFPISFIFSLFRKIPLNSNTNIISIIITIIFSINSYFLIQVLLIIFKDKDYIKKYDITSIKLDGFQRIENQHDSLNINENKEIKIDKNLFDNYYPIIKNIRRNESNYTFELTNNDDIDILFLYFENTLYYKFIKNYKLKKVLIDVISEKIKEL